MTRVPDRGISDVYENSSVLAAVDNFESCSFSTQPFLILRGETDTGAGDVSGVILNRGNTGSEDAGNVVLTGTINADGIYSGTTADDYVEHGGFVGTGRF